MAAQRHSLLTHAGFFTTVLSSMEVSVGMAIHLRNFCKCQSGVILQNKVQNNSEL